MRKLIISKTLLFLYIVLFVAGFKIVFGEENTLIGVTIVIALLMYNHIDLTVNPWRNFFLLLGLNILQGVFAYISVINIWIGLPLNFIAMFIVGYFFSFNMKSQLYIAFGLQYLFIFATPVLADDLPLRLLALASGAVIIMGSQFIRNRDNLSKTGNKLLLSVCNHLIQKLESISNQKDYVECNTSIENDIKALRKIIIYRRYKGYFLSNEGRLKLKISACLEKINILFNRLNQLDNKEEIITALMQEIKNVKQSIKEQTINRDTLNNLHHLAPTTNSLYIHEIVNSFELLYDLLQESVVSNKNELNKIDSALDIPNKFKKSYYFLVDLNIHSPRFTYAMRLAIVISIAAFFTSYFELEQGRWILYTIFSVTQPYFEQAKYRFSERIIGTLIGTVIFIVLFSVFSDITIRSLIVLLFGYLNSFAVKYRNVIITVTVSVLGSAALISDPHIITIERVLFIIVGVLIGMVANRFILPHSIREGTETLVEKYKYTSKMLMEEIFEFFKTKSNSHSINNLYAITSFIEDRILLNNMTMNVKSLNEYLANQRKLNNGMYELFLRVNKDHIDHQTAKLMLETMNQIMNRNILEYDQIINQLTKDSDTKIRLEDEILVKDVWEILKGFKQISTYTVELEKAKT